MKNLSLVLNVVLLLAVGILYYLHFSDKKPGAAKPAITAPRTTGTETDRPLIAYVEIDSLNDNILYIKNKRKELEGEQKKIEADWDNSCRVLENKKDNFLKKGNAITQEMAQQFQGELMQEKQQVDDRRQALSQQLNEKSYKFMEEVQKKLKEFLGEYNSQKNFTYIFTTGAGFDYMVYKDSSLNITADVIAGMNEKMATAAK